MIAMSIVGFSKSGKTSLIGLLIHELEQRGLRVAIAKHTHHQLDKPDTDTAKIMAPNRTVIGLGENESMLFWGKQQHLRDLLPLLEADILLVEGGKSLGWLPRILCLHEAQKPEVCTSEINDPCALRPDLAVACFGTTGLPNLPLFTIETIAQLTDILLEKACILPGLDCGACGEPDCAGLMRRIVRGEASTKDCLAANQNVTVSINGQVVGLNPFTARMLSGGIEGMLRSLKGFAPGKMEITLTL